MTRWGLLAIQLTVIACVVCGVILAQFSVPRGFIHQKFPEGHVGYPGGFSVIENRGWPLAFRSEWLPDWDQLGVQHSGLKLSVDVAVGVGIVVSTAAVLCRLRRTFSLSTFLQAVLGIGMFLAATRQIRIPSGWFTSSSIVFGMLCASLVIAHVLVRSLAVALDRLRTN